MPVPAEDSRLLRILAEAHAESERRSGGWLLCRPGCSQCCLGPVEIGALDAERLRDGMARLDSSDPERAWRVRDRAAAHAALPPADADDAPCPALDPDSRTCDLYAARPVLCRVFGPAIPVGGGAVGHCELCYDGASTEELAACVIDFDPEGIENRIEASMPRETTTVARVLYLAASR